MSDATVSPADRDRIERALDGLLGPEELARLQADVVRDPALRAAYVERRWVDSLLRAERDRLPQLLGTADERKPAGRAQNPVAWLLFAVAASAVIGMGLWQARRPAPPTPTVATLVQAQNTKWANSTLPTAEQSRLGTGTLALVEGIATLKFASGATLTMEAPTKLEILDAMHCRLIEGSVTAEVPESAHGFTVTTTDLKVVDLGTRFGVTAGSAGNSHVFVFEGEVKLDTPQGAEVRRLTEGKSFHVGSGAAGSNLEPTRFQPVKHVDGWTTIPTSFGRGKDGFVRRGSSLDTRTQPLLMVKHSDLPLSHRNERRAFLTFDLSDASLAQLTEAELVLDPEPSGMGFSTMVPDSRFAVYGVTDEAVDLWTEETLSWETAPVTGEPGLDPAKVRRLAEFPLPRGASGDPLTIGGRELLEFLRSDRNGLVTFVIVRETGESDPTGLVHAFASKEHPTARPPTLRLR